MCMYMYVHMYPVPLVEKKHLFACVYVLWIFAASVQMMLHHIFVFQHVRILGSALLERNAFMNIYIYKNI